MKKLIYLLLLASANTIFAQDIPDEEIRKKIRDIKLSEKYVYAEANSVESPVDAKQVATDKLKASAVSLMAEDNQSKEKIKESLNLVENEQLVLEYSNGNLFKAFACIPKNKLVAGTESDQPNGENTGQPVVETPQEAVAAAMPVVETDSLPAPATLPPDAVAATDSIALIPADPNMPTENTFSVDANTAALVIEMLSMTGSKAQKAFTSAETKQATAVGTDTIAHTTETAESLAKQAMDNIPEEHLKIINDLLALDTYESVMLYLNAMKEDGRMMYGPLKKIFMPERAYMIILKDGQMVTVLDKGKGDRLNIKTQELESLQKYIGYGIVWFQIYNRPKI